jgi:hypothetical protein
MQRNCEWLCEWADCRSDVFWEHVRVACANGDKVRRAAGTVGTNQGPVLAQLFLASKAGIATAVVHVRTNGNPLPERDFCHEVAPVNDLARKLVADDTRQGGRVQSRKAIRPLVVDREIGAADAASRNSYEDLLCSYLGDSGLA